jgi:aromatic-L-amino-acid decarboxylase
MTLWAGLPDKFLCRSPGSRGGGVIQSSASECVLDCLLAARAQAIRQLLIAAQLLLLSSA